ncbi:MAG: SBBP repeat-containing protein [Candidatus Hodarchaeota archaeon]
MNRQDILELEEVVQNPSQLSEIPEKLPVTGNIIPFGGFIENNGQYNDDSLKYYYKGEQNSVYFYKSKVSFGIFDTQLNETISIDITCPNSNLVEPAGRKQNAHKINIFKGDFKCTDITTWNEIWYDNLYPGIDLRYYHSDQGLKYDFQVNPGSNPNDINIQIDGPINLIVEDDLVSIQSDYSNSVIYLEDSGLYVFQMNPNLEKIEAIFKDIIDGQNSYTFKIKNYDSRSTLIIDPVWLHFSTYLGGNDSDEGRDITVDTQGNCYVTGYTYSDNFPILNENQTRQQNRDVFVTKINSTGNGLVYSTFIGGTQYDRGSAIFVDDSGSAYITGETYSSDFPFENPYQTYNASADAFVVKLSPSGNVIEYCTCLGTNMMDYGYGIAVDGSGNCYVSGQTGAAGFPVTLNRYQTHQGGTDAFVTKLNATGNGLLFSTYIGGNNTDYCSGIDFDQSGNCYIIGYTLSSNFPLVNELQNVTGGGYDIFVTKLNSSGDGLVYSSKIGGDAAEYGRDIVVDTSGNCYVTGNTDSSNFPTVNPYQTDQPSMDVIAFKLNATGNGLLYSTYIGGDDYDYAQACAIDDLGNCYIAGDTESSNFPLNHSLQSLNTRDAFVLKLNTSGNGVVYSTLLGGDGNSYGRGIAVDDDNNAYITGYTTGSGYPMVNPLYGPQGGDDAYVSKISNRSDDSNPNVSLNSPVNAQWYNTSTVIDCEILDADSGIDTVYYYWKNDTNEPNWTSVGIPWSPDYNTTIPAGPLGGIYLHVFANDSVGHTNSTYFTFYRDDEKPTLILTGPPEDQWYPEGESIDCDFSDGAGSGLDLVKYQWRTGVTPPDWSTQGNVWSGNYTVPLFAPPTAPRDINLHVYARDVAGNENSTYFRFLVDNQNPNVTLNDPTENQWYQPGELIDCNLTDGAGAGMGVVEYEWSTSATLPNWNLTGTPWSAPWDTSMPTRPGGPGIYYLHIYAADDVGNVNETTFQFLCDQDAPSVELISPPDDQWYFPGTVIDCNISDNVGSGLDIVLYEWRTNTSAPDWNSTGVNWSSPYNTSIPAGAPGYVYLHIFANDSLGNQNYTYFTFGRDDEEPNTILLSPPEAQWYLPGTLVNCTISDGAGCGLDVVKYFWSENTSAFDWDTEGTNWTAPYDVTIPSGPTGLAYLHVYANDTIGNWNYTYFEFLRDGEQPNITLNNLLENQWYCPNITVNCTVSDLSGVGLDTVKYLWSLNTSVPDWDTSGNVWNATYEAIMPDGITGYIYLHVFANDTLGNQDDVIFTFRRDGEIPTIGLLFPPEGSDTEPGDQIIVDFDDSAGSGIAMVKIYWSDSMTPPDWGTEGEEISSPYTIKIPKGPEGDLFLHVFINDTVGNNNTKVFSFVRTKVTSPMNFTQILLIIAIIIVAAILSGAVIIYLRKRTKKEKVKRKPIKVKEKVTTPRGPVQPVKSRKGKAPGVEQDESEKALTAEEIDELTRTEQEVTAKMEEQTCIVHKGPISGTNYSCPKCKTFYCLKCATTLAEKGEDCWSCGNPIELETTEKKKEKTEPEKEDTNDKE